MRKFSMVVAAVVALGLAMAPGVEAASADLVGAVQQQISNAGGMLPTTDAAEAEFIDGLVAAGVLPADQAAARQTLHAIASVDTHATADTVAYLLGSGLTPSQITGLINMTPPAEYDQFLQGFNLPSGQAPTGMSLAPLSSQLRLLASTNGADPDAAGVLAGLANEMDAGGSSALPARLLDQLQGALAALGALSPSGADALTKLLASLVPAAPTSASTPAQPAPAATSTSEAQPAVVPARLVLKVVKIKLARNRKTEAVTLRSSAPAARLPVAFATTVGGKAAAKPVRFTLASGKNVTKKVTLTRPATRTLKKKGGRLVVTPAFNVPGLSSVPGVTLAESAKSVKVHRPHARKKHRKR
jgi:hypothetical protein